MFNYGYVPRSVSLLVLVGTIYCSLADVNSVINYYIVFCCEVPCFCGGRCTKQGNFNIAILNI